MNKFDLENIKKNLLSELEKNLKTKINELEQKHFELDNFFEDDNLILNSKIENECFEDDFFNSESDEKTNLTLLSYDKTQKIKSIYKLYNEIDESIFS